MASRRKILKYSLYMGAGALGLYTWRFEPTWLEIVQKKLPIRNLPKELEGASLVQVSDLHIGTQVDDAYLINTFERVRRIDPAIVVYTGDFISRKDRVDEQCQRVLGECARGTLGTFGVLGNHDYGTNFRDASVADGVCKTARESGIRMLRNEVTEISGLQICGLEDLWGGQFDLRAGMGKLDASKPALVLSHNPDSADEAGWGEYQGWILSGHTHGGQCKPPFLPPPFIPVKNRRYTAGTFDLEGGRSLYINRGVGYLYRVRFNVRPEVTWFELVRG